MTYMEKMVIRRGHPKHIIVGIVGGLVGGFLFNLIGVQGATGFNIWSIFVAFIGNRRQRKLRKRFMIGLTNIWINTGCGRTRPSQVISAQTVEHDGSLNLR